MRTRLRRDHRGRRPLRRHRRRAPGAGGMAGCRHREGAVPAAQSVRRVHFRTRRGRCCGSWAWPVHCWKIAGPPVRRVGVYAGDAMVTADWPRRRRAADGGRALGREHLDTLLLRRAAAAGADVWQPCALSAFVAHDGGYECTIVDKGTRQVPRVAFAADHRRARLLGIRRDADAGLAPSAARLGSVRLQGPFHDSALPPDLMPLLAFPGRLWRNGAHRWRSRQPVVLHPPRPARTHAGRQWPHVKAGRSGPRAHRVVVQGCRAGAARRDAGRRMAVVRAAADGNSHLRPRWHLRGRQRGRRSASHRRRRHQHGHSIRGAAVRATDCAPGSARRPHRVPRRSKAGPA